MSERDPIPELKEVLDLAEGGKLPRAAAEWATGALDTAESILETADAMFANGVDAPTDGQKRALSNIYRAACRWLGRTPEED